MSNEIYVRKTTLAYCLLSFIFILIASFRGATRDTDIYKFVYENSNLFPLEYTQFYDKTGMEIGYGYLSFIFNILSLPFSFFLFFISFLTFFFIKKASDNFSINSFYVLICYIPVFFANHQLMQIRQGLAMAIGYYFLSLILKNKNKILAFIVLISGYLFHSVTLVFFAFFSNLINSFIATERIKLFIKVFFVCFFVFVFCRFFSGLDFFQYTERLSNYTDSEFSTERGFLHPANIRSFLLLIFFVIFKPKNEGFIYNFLVVFYAAGLGFRLGFYDFMILSGRLSTIFTYSEIFLVPMLLVFRFSKQNIIVLLLIYFLINLYINLVFQVPFILEDYFKPLL